jgi:hypothetical protein
MTVLAALVGYFAGVFTMIVCHVLFADVPPNDQ